MKFEIDTLWRLPWILQICPECSKLELEFQAFPDDNIHPHAGLRNRAPTNVELPTIYSSFDHVSDSNGSSEIHSHLLVSSRFCVSFKQDYNRICRCFSVYIFIYSWCPVVGVNPLHFAFLWPTPNVRSLFYGFIRSFSSPDYGKPRRCVQ